MKKLFFGVAVLVLVYSGQASAGIIGVITHDYGIGKDDPGGNDVLSADHVTVSDQSSGRFYDVFDFSMFSGTITSLDLTLDFGNVDAGLCLGFFNLGECWYARLQGSNGGEDSDDLLVLLEDDLSLQTITVSAATDVGGVDVFARSIVGGQLELWFAEETLSSESFLLRSATLRVNGESAALPEPSMLGLMGLGLGVAGWMSRRRRQAVVAGDKLAENV